MNTQSQVTPAFQISAVSIRQDIDGRYCINDLHKASGGERKHRPSRWLDSQQTKDLIAEFELEAGKPASKIIKGRGITATLYDEF